MPSLSGERGEVRNLDQIQEEEPRGVGGRVGGLVLASVGGACIVFAALALMRTPAKPKATAVDPLGDLVTRSGAAAPSGKKPSETALDDVTFPSALSDARRPTTALEAVRAAGSAQAPAGDVNAALVPPPALDRLPVVPLPAQQVLEPVASAPAPRDGLGALAKHLARDDGAEVAAGSAGGYQLQVSSFKVESEGLAFAAALRRRGHHAYVEAADVQGRGTWHRVRIGPFKTKHAAVIYRQDFEAKERLVTFIIDPPKKIAGLMRPADEPAKKGASGMKISDAP